MLVFIGIVTILAMIGAVLSVVAPVWFTLFYIYFSHFMKYLFLFFYFSEIKRNYKNEKKFYSVKYKLSMVSSLMRSKSIRRIAYGFIWRSCWLTILVKHLIKIREIEEWSSFETFIKLLIDIMTCLFKTIMLYFHWYVFIQCLSH